MKQIRKKLVDEYGIKIPTSTIDCILKNPFYYGVMSIKGALYPHQYEPIIMKELYDKVQQVKVNHNKQPFKYAGLPYYYRGD